MSETKIIEKLTSPHKITLYLNGSNPYIYFYFTWKKKSHRGSTGTDSIEVSRNKVLEIFYEISKGIREKGRQKIIKFENVVKDFLKYKKDHVSVRTINDYQKSSQFLLERFKGRDVVTISDKREYESYKKWRQQYYEIYKKKRIRKYKRNGKMINGRKNDHVGNVVINRELRLLVSILRYGKEYMNLFKGIDIPPYTMLPEKRRDEILSDEEYIKLRNYWMKKNPFYGHMISFLSNSGVRYPSEMNRLQWKDVNFEQNYIVIRNRKSRNNTLESIIPLVTTLRNNLNWLQTRKGISTNPEDYVFVNEKNKPIKNIVRSFKRSLRDLGITKNITLYSFRHFYTSHMVQRSDIPLYTLSKVLGHVNTTTLQKRYTVTNSKDIVDIFMKSDDQNKQKIPEEQIPGKDHPIRVFFDTE